MGRYKFTLDPKVKGYVEWTLERYRIEKKLLDAYKQDLIPSATQSYSTTGGVKCSGTSNPTEQSAIRLATSPYILSAERSIRAVESVLAHCDETDRKLIDLVYWRRTHTVVGAGEKIGLGQNGCYKRINKILASIALELGLINP